MSTEILKFDGIKNFDKIVSLEPCWHHLEKIEPEITFANSGLNWNVKQVPLHTQRTDGNYHLLPDYKAVVRDGTNVVMGVFKDTYTIIQNSRIWQCVENSLSGVAHKIAVAGSLGNCHRVFISVKLDAQQEFVVNRDTFKDFLTFCSSHDETLAFEAYDTSIRVVCQNTLNASRRAKGHLNLKVSHTAYAEDRIVNMEEVIEQMFEKRKEFYSSLEYLASKPMSLSQANKILIGFNAPMPAGDKGLSNRTINKLTAMSNLFADGKGNNGETYYDLLNGVTDYWTHNGNEDHPEKRLLANEFGLAGQQKVAFYDTLMDDAALEKIAKRGEELLKLLPKEQAMQLA